MRTSRFAGDYASLAGLLGQDPDVLRRQDADHGASRRWVAEDEAHLVALATESLRPDGRSFLRFAGVADLIGDLSRRAVEDLRAPVHATVDESSLQGFIDVGYVIELTTEAFDVGFGEALRRLRRAWIPAGYSMISAAEADRDRLFDLDNTIRNDVPGCDGWAGNRTWFDDELTDSPPFDPDGYLVMVDPVGTYTGLVRMWRNSEGPRLGLVGTVRSHRRPPFAAALLQRCLAAATEWGHAMFTTEAALSNPVTHPALIRLGAVSRGRSYQVVLYPE